MTEKEYLLQCLAEEGIEVAHAISKALRFGLEDHYPGKPNPTNRVRIVEEINDFLAAVEMVKEALNLPGIGERKAIEQKKFKVFAMTKYSQLRGKIKE